MVWATLRRSLANNLSDRQANRWVGAAVAALSVLFMLWVIPNHSSASATGWMRPRTLPTICASVLVLAGLGLLLRPVGAVDLPLRRWLRAGAILAAILLGLLGFAQVGFLATAPLLLVALMLLAGERRPLWIIGGGVLIPGFVWVTVTILLSRPLP